MTRRPWIRYRLGAALTVAATLGCPEPGPGPEQAESVRITPAALNLVVGEQRPLSATVHARSGAVLSGRTPTWTSSSPAVAIVHPSSGLVTAVAPGQATITATVEGRAGSMDVRVAPPPKLLTVVLTGSGNGAVTSSPAGIQCARVSGATSGTCTSPFPEGTTVTLTPQGSGGHQFTGWTGDCTGSGSCQVVLDQTREVSASFGAMHQVSIVTSGSGEGSVTSAPDGITCRRIGSGEEGTCALHYPLGETVTLTAAPVGGASQFAGWSGAGCGGTGACVLTVSAGHEVTAQFVRTELLTVVMAGDGSGQVTSSAGGIACASAAGTPSGTCMASYPQGTTVTLSAQDAGTSRFTGWSGGGCTGTGTCTVTLSTARQVTATFSGPVTLTVALAGAGRVVSTPAAIDCLRTTAGVQSGTCQTTVPAGSIFSLDAIAGPDHVLTGWSGAPCFNLGNCPVTVSAPQTVTATFGRLMPLTVFGLGAGHGTVISAPGPINCNLTQGMPTGPTCGVTFSGGTAVVLTAQAASGSAFVGWSGDGCAGTAPCQVLMSVARVVRAEFAPAGPGLGVGFDASQFALVAPGTFQMGSNTGFAPEQPAHAVTLTSPFYIQRTEVTQGQWQQVMGTNPSIFSACGALCPVENVSWNEVHLFLAALNAQDPGKQYRLPTEAEWEVAARAGTTGDYSGTGVLDQMGWYAGNAGGTTRPVAQKLPNALGLYDVHGNAREWTSNWFESYTSTPKTDPQGPATGSLKVQRGGPFNGAATAVRSSVRAQSAPELRDNTSGFRLVRSTGGSAPPAVALAASSWHFTAVRGGGPPAGQAVGIAASSGIIGGLAASVSYLSGSGWLAVAVHPTSTPATLTLQVTTANLAPGTYQATVTVAGTGAAPATISVSYQVAAAPVTQNFRIAGMYLTQGIQRMDQSVILVGDGEAWVRVFVSAQVPGPIPEVRVYIGQAGTAVTTGILTNQPAGFSPFINEGALSTSWNIRIPGHLIRPGMTVRAEVDFDNVIPETNEADNRFPLDGSSRPVSVYSLPVIFHRLVPIACGFNGQAYDWPGDLTSQNYESYLYETRKLLPIVHWGVSLRPALALSSCPLEANDGNGNWSRMLHELYLVKLKEFQFRNYYWYGVLRLNYTGDGTLGRGYVVPGQGDVYYRVAIGTDRPQSRGVTYAHELGHNFGRSHAPCGGAPDPDPNFPDPEGKIGAWGLDLATGSTYDPSDRDVMGYCAPTWVSPYTWNGVAQWRAGSPHAAPAATPTVAAGGEEDGLLVWGRIGPDGVEIEPTFRAVPGPEPLGGTGRWRVEGFDAAGAPVFSHRFEPAEVADAPRGPEYHFGMVLPLGKAAADRVARLRVSGPGGTDELRAAPPGPAAAPAVEPSARAIVGGGRRIIWDGSRYPMAIISDPVTGLILGVARGGVATLPGPARGFELELSDGVQVLRRRVEVP